jgi:phage gpG-like protein
LEDLHLLWDGYGDIVPPRSVTSVGGLSIRPRVTQQNVPQLAFSPSIGIVARDVDKLGMDIQSFRIPLKRAVQQVIIPSIQQNFAAEGRPDPWEPYSEGTLELRERQGSPVGKLLDKTGALKAAMRRVDIWTINNTAAILLDLPSNVGYGKVHQQGRGATSFRERTRRFGGDAGKAFNTLQNDIKKAQRDGLTLRNVVGIPARPFIMIQPEDEQRIEEVFIIWLNLLITKHWGSRG